MRIDLKSGTLEGNGVGMVTHLSWGHSHTISR
jgi:hypothetical protein